MDAIVGAIAGEVIQRLSSLAEKEFDIILNVNDDRRNTEYMASAIKAKLLDAEAKTADHQTTNWLEKLEDILYDVDDLLDDFSIEDLKRNAMTGNNFVKWLRVFFSKSNQIAYGLKLGHEMREIHNRLDGIDKINHVLQITRHFGEPQTENREQRNTWSFVSQEEVIGREEEKKLIKSYLLEETNAKENVSVIHIVGIGGLGKTTLAQLVYNDNDVQRYFVQKMWVYVSDESDIKKIAQKIIGNDRNCEMEQVLQDLRNKIQGKKFLLVLDDVWNEDPELWRKLMQLFAEGGKGSMIIVTTRSQIVARIMKQNHPHLHLDLEGLDPQRSLKLFRQAAKENDLELLAIGSDIVKKCAGVPLAIRTIGSLLHTRNLGLGDWKYFRDEAFTKID